MVETDNFIHLLIFASICALFIFPIVWLLMSLLDKKLLSHLLFKKDIHNDAPNNQEKENPSCSQRCVINDGSTNKNTHYGEDKNHPPSSILIHLRSIIKRVKTKCK